ncbi:hypothetical protein [Streptomyces sp. NPDC051567]|uniref:terpene synthase family protein n=1 Tax=Streptomyces sp. NPDC051567 TaxID=3365660 RepID=UPI003798CC5A
MSPAQGPPTGDPSAGDPSAGDSVAGVVEAHAAAALHRWDMVRDEEVRGRLVRTGIGASVVRCFPAADLDGQRVVAETFMWFTAFDDLHESGDGNKGENGDGTGPAPGAVDTAVVIARLVGILESGGPGEPGGPGGLVGRGGPCGPVGPGGARGTVDDATVAAFASVTATLRPRLSPAQFGRLADAVRGYFLAVLWERSAREVTAADYLTMRRHLSFARMLPPLVEWATGQELADAFHRGPVTDHLLKRFCDVVLLFNDIVSFPWEQAHGPDTGELSNLITITARRDGCPVEDAADRVRAMLDEACAAYRALRDSLARSAPWSRTYLRGLDDFLDGLLSDHLPGRYGTATTGTEPATGTGTVTEPATGTGTATGARAGTATGSTATTASRI